MQIGQRFWYLSRARLDWIEWLRILCPQGAKRQNSRAFPQAMPSKHGIIGAQVKPAAIWAYWDRPYTRKHRTRHLLPDAYPPRALAALPVGQDMWGIPVWDILV